MRTIPVMLCLGGLLSACADRPMVTGPDASLRPSFNGWAPEPVGITFDIDGVCSFPVQAEITGSEKLILRPNGSLIVASPGMTTTLANLDTGKSTSHVITGTIFVEFLDNGDAVIGLTGRNLVQDEAGLFITVGAWSQVIDISGNYVQALQGTGRKIDVCAALS